MASKDDKRPPPAERAEHLDPDRDAPHGGDPDDPARLAPPRVAALDRPGDPPVVARLMVEIRSDGRFTIARGAMEDAATGRGVAIEATGRSPLQLAMSLARSLVTLPAFGRSAARALLLGPRRGRRGRPGH